MRSDAPSAPRLARGEVATGGHDWIRKSRTLARLSPLIEPPHAPVRPEAARLASGPPVTRVTAIL
jgi:hypothetical protein